MRDFMRALPKDVLFQSSCNLYPESHKTQVWLCFLFLSFLRTTCALSVPVTADLQICVEKLSPTIEKSDAMLYAPSINDIKDNCRNMSLKCYMLELIMVLTEEDVVHSKTECILMFNEALRPEDGCPPCETYSLTNITVFLDRLNTLLEDMTYRHNIT